MKASLHPSRLGLLALLACFAACSSNASTPTGPGTDAGGDGTSNACGEINGTSGIALCGACIDVHCCTEILSCAADSQCTLLQTCLTRCQPTDRNCTSACSNLYPSGVTLYNNQTNCAGLLCNQACSMPPAGCSNVPLDVTGNCAQTPFPRVWDCPAGAPEPQCVAAPDGTANRFCCLQ